MPPALLEQTIVAIWRAEHCPETERASNWREAHRLLDELRAILANHGHFISRDELLVSLHERRRTYEQQVRKGQVKP